MIISYGIFKYVFSAVLFAILFCLNPFSAFAETVSGGNTMASASDLVPVTDASRMPLPDENKSSTEPAISALPTNPAPEIKSRQLGLQKPIPEISQNRPLSISIDPDDKKAHLAIEESLRIFTQSIKPRFSMWLERSGRYVEIMQDILRERDMPTELVFLPIVESGFSTKAYSRARAAGPWQFISGTAKRYGLVIDFWKDERKDPIKSTVAAASYLRDLYKMFGSWSLALAAYNAGEGRISKALKRSNSDDYWALLSTSQIRKETKDYVPRYIAAAMIANTPERYGFDNLAYHQPFEYDEVVIYHPVDLEIIAQCSGTGIETIRELNPELRRWSTPANMREYTLRIPVGRSDSFIEKLSLIPDKKLFTYDTYIVKKNDNIKKIAAREKVPVSVILELNSLAGIERLEPGEVVKLPPHGKYFADIDDKMMALKAAKDKRSKNRCVVKGKKGKKRYVACNSDDGNKVAKKQCVVKDKRGKKKYVACGDDDDNKIARGKKGRKYAAAEDEDGKAGKKKCVVKGKKGKKKYVACSEDIDNKTAKGKRVSKKFAAANDDNEKADKKLSRNKRAKGRHVADNDDHEKVSKKHAGKKDGKTDKTHVSNKKQDKDNDKNVKAKAKVKGKTAKTNGTNGKKVKNTSKKSGKKSEEKA
jgi:membrane-bound lytic murein transglycosylase D